MKRKLMLVLVALLALFAVSAQQKEIRVLLANHPYGDLLKSAIPEYEKATGVKAVSYTHLRAHETPEHIVCRLLLEKKKQKDKNNG